MTLQQYSRRNPASTAGFFYSRQELGEQPTAEATSQKSPPANQQKLEQSGTSVSCPGPLRRSDTTEPVIEVPASSFCFIPDAYESDQIGHRQCAGRDIAEMRKERFRII
jgi:hypothetical protein